MSDALGQDSPEYLNKYPLALSELIALFESFSEGERRENLIDLAGSSASFAPKKVDKFDLEDVRQDVECTDKVGVHVSVGKDGRVHFAFSLGPNVQTLTKAMAAILCRGLNGSTLEAIVAVPQDFIPRIIGSELVRLRSRTVYYLLNRVKQAAGILAQAPQKICLHGGHIIPRSEESAKTQIKTDKTYE